MNARRKRRHPLAELVMWLGLSLLATLAALVWVVAQLPADAQLDNSHMAGMKEGYDMCLAYEENVRERTAAKPVLLGGSL